MPLFLTDFKPFPRKMPKAVVAAKIINEIGLIPPTNPIFEHFIAIMTLRMNYYCQNDCK